ncbi:MAG: hypothetical protein IIA67_02655 [Planctomycetes bacterium]|nr:hypothetical protein [Planctomycetota bacterium]
MSDDTPKRRWYQFRPRTRLVHITAVAILTALNLRVTTNQVVFDTQYNRGWPLSFQSWGNNWFGGYSNVSLTGIAVDVTVALAVLALLHWFSERPKSKRRWHQFSLKTLLIVMTLFTTTAGGIGGRMFQARVNQNSAAAARMRIRETEAVVEIEKLGGNVYFKRLRPQTWLERRFDDPGAGDDPVRSREVTGVSFWGTRNVTDAGLAHLNELKNLEELNLNDTQVTDAVLEHVKGLTNLRELYLAHTNVTDAGLDHLSGLKTLERLDLSHTKITDAGLEHLKGLRRLSHLDLRGTDVTDEGVKKFQEVSSCGIDH